MPGENGKSYRFLLLAAAVSTVLGVTGCQQAPPAMPDTRASDEAAIRAAEAAMAKTAAPMDPAGMVSFYTDDVVGLSADSPLVQGKENMLKVFDEMAKRGNPRISWTPAKIEVARSGDLAYSWGTGEYTVADAKGKDTTNPVKYVSIWKKQPDGAWKIAVDSMLPNPPEKK